ncbi:hypothetical protein AMATHDRAFT_2128 [Amanita thiersii Skay4041]|uniref:Uncharacterized protein n=1 Tax=Amanita thiersii Skay4041 TaxID=703135 RepID=A0A2A9NXB3_9AGAR|nr:hypothetical protein AMATHDRAFT_2128 [Amanita thiersii Skay4041]
MSSAFSIPRSLSPHNSEDEVVWSLSESSISFSAQSSAENGVLQQHETESNEDEDDSDFVLLRRPPPLGARGRHWADLTSESEFSDGEDTRYADHKRSPFSPSTTPAPVLFNASNKQSPEEAVTNTSSPSPSPHARLGTAVSATVFPTGVSTGASSGEAVAATCARKSKKKAKAPVKDVQQTPKAKAKAQLKPEPPSPVPATTHLLPAPFSSSSQNGDKNPLQIAIDQAREAVRKQRRERRKEARKRKREEQKKEKKKEKKERKKEKKLKEQASMGATGASTGATQKNSQMPPKPKTLKTPKPAVKTTITPPEMFDEASTFITSFLANPLAQKDTVCRLTLLQSLIVELGFASTSLPASLRAARMFLKSRAFLNIKEYLATRNQGQFAIQRLLHPSRSALIKDIKRKRNPASLKWVKQQGLDVLLVSCFN